YSALANQEDGDVDSLASLSDNLAIWIEGEEHCISGVDANTTCSDLICALLSYQSSTSGSSVQQRDQEYAIVQKQRHYEEYLDGSARLCDVIANRHALPKEECQLQLRHLANSALMSKLTPTTDKDSGMGSPVDSSRSIRFRRRGRHKGQFQAHSLVALDAIEQWGETRASTNQAKQPKRSRKLQQQQKGHCQMNQNESLLTIILAQDETILQQMSMLHEKDRQILKIEEEKHRKRERELGKNYLLETYLKDLEEPQVNDLMAKDLEERILGLPIEGEPKDLVDPYDSNDEMRLYWLEKIHAVNKQLQREEELLLSLHAKVRRHQVKRAYQTKSEVLLQIDKLDSELADQVTDIHRVERKLFTANEQLKAKLGVLECLGREFETTVAGSDCEQAEKLAKLIQSSTQSQPDLRVSVPIDESSLSNQNHNINLNCIPNRNRCLIQQELTDKNLNDHQMPDKGLSKQMFAASRTEENPLPISEKAKIILPCPCPETDIQHLGTLV
ncbi:hypothetical protein KR009_006728, partial [Drosophila setifemur]